MKKIKGKSCDVPEMGCFPFLSPVTVLPEIKKFPGLVYIPLLRIFIFWHCYFWIDNWHVILLHIFLPRNPQADFSSGFLKRYLFFIFSFRRPMVAGKKKLLRVECIFVLRGTISVIMKKTMAKELLSFDCSIILFLLSPFTNVFSEIM